MGASRQRAANVAGILHAKTPRRRGKNNSLRLCAFAPLRYSGSCISRVSRFRKFLDEDLGQRGWLDFQLKKSKECSYPFVLSGKIAPHGRHG
jgi:hypothetical protein